MKPYRDSDDGQDPRLWLAGAIVCFAAAAFAALVMLSGVAQ